MQLEADGGPDSEDLVGLSESSPERAQSRRMSGFRDGGGTGTHPTPPPPPPPHTFLIPDVRYIITQLIAHSPRGAALEDTWGRTPLSALTGA